MKGFFYVESPFMQMLARLVDVVLLNLLFVVTSLPIVTIGASWTSLLTVWQHILRGDDNNIVQNYFRFFKNNWKQATILWGITATLAAVFTLDFLLLQQANQPLKAIGLGILFVFVLLLLAISSSSFAYIGRYQDDLKRVIKNGFILLINQLPYILGLVIINGLSIYLSVSSPERLLTAIYSFTFFAFSLIACVNAWMMKKVFTKLEIMNNEVQK